MSSFLPQEPARDYRLIDAKLGLPTYDGLVKLAKAMDRMHEGAASTRVLVEDYRVIGLLGERHFARTFRLPMDTRILRWGNARKPFTLSDGTVVDVMTRRAPKHQPYPDLTLRVKARRGPDVVALISFEDLLHEPVIVGWIPDEKIRQEFPIVTMRDDVENYHVPWQELWSADVLLRHHEQGPRPRAWDRWDDLVTMYGQSLSNVNLTPEPVTDPEPEYKPEPVRTLSLW